MNSGKGRVLGRDRALYVFGVFAAILIAGGGYVLIEFIGRDLPTYGPSMRPTITGNQPVEINSDAYASADPQIGDVVVLQAPRGLRAGRCPVDHTRASPCPEAADGYETIRLIKRVVAGAGDRVAFTPEGQLIRNDRILAEDYIVECPGTCGLPRAITVPPGHYFVAGDNRPKSSDSRIWGPVPAEAIDGRVALGSG